MTTTLSRVEELRNDIENLEFQRRYYFGILAELEQLGKTGTADFKELERGVQIIGKNIKRLESELEDVEASEMLDNALEQLTADEIEEFWN